MRLAAVLVHRSGLAGAEESHQPGGRIVDEGRAPNSAPLLIAEFSTILNSRMALNCGREVIEQAFGLIPHLSGLTPHLFGIRCCALEVRLIHV